jgi:hypothetical protein
MQTELQRLVFAETAHVIPGDESHVNVTAKDGGDTVEAFLVDRDTPPAEQGLYPAATPHGERITVLYNPASVRII